MRTLTRALGATLIVLTAGLMSPATAADLGSSCCSDLEERIANLEAVAATKGNRKVTLVISGQVSRAILYVSEDGFNDKKLIDNTNSPTRFTFSGNGKISPNVKAGFILEVGLGNAADLDKIVELALNGANTNNDLMVRHAAAWIEGEPGRLTMGKTSQSTDNFDEMSTANTIVASRLLSFGPLTAVYGFGFDTPFDGARREVVRYDSPTLAGFIGSASWSGDHQWDAALRWATEAGGFRMMGGLGYRADSNYGSGLLTFPVEFTTVLASGSVMHMVSGLFVTGMYADSNFNGSHLKAWHVQGGIEAALAPTGFGKTTFYGEFMRLTDTDGILLGSGDAWGFGVVQAVDNAALDIFVGYRRYDDSLQTGLGGIRLRF